MGQGVEPIILALNRGKDDYPVTNHIATFENRPEISKYNAYITHYQASPSQIQRFDASHEVIRYQNLIKDSDPNTHVGPVFGNWTNESTEEDDSESEL